MNGLYRFFKIFVLLFFILIFFLNILFVFENSVETFLSSMDYDSYEGVVFRIPIPMISSKIMYARDDDGDVDLHYLKISGKKDFLSYLDIIRDRLDIEQKILKKQQIRNTILLDMFYYPGWRFSYWWHKNSMVHQKSNDNSVYMAYSLELQEVYIWYFNE